MESKEVDDNSKNGLILNDKYIPEELIVQILCKVDDDALLNCHLVCVRWKTLMETYVWKKKAEIILCRSLNCIKDVNWSVFYAVCTRKPFERNLVKNCSGQNGIGEYWEIVENNDRRDGIVNAWTVESPPKMMPPGSLEEPNFCFATSFNDGNNESNESIKKQIIDLSSEGLSTHILDLLQPPIAVSEWYGIQYFHEGLYEFSVQLLGDEDKVLDTFEFRDYIRSHNPDRWHHIAHVFTNYGQGLKKILFRHAGMDISPEVSEGLKITCASVRVKILKEDQSINDVLYIPEHPRESLSMYQPSLKHYFRDMRRRQNAALRMCVYPLPPRREQE